MPTGEPSPLSNARASSPEEEGFSLAHCAVLQGTASGGKNDGFIGGLWVALSPAGWATQWYWPQGTRGKVHNFLHGKGWRVG